ncbi:MAG: hypothetical protein P1P76_10950 [Anaerolineales bacterium]|nr:hypothetical protein [Anaerolineales bacterium]
MPILDITLVLADELTLAEGTAKQLADAAAAVFQSTPGRTWVKLRTLTADQYAEDDGGPPEDVAPVFVSVLKASLDHQGALADEALALTEAIAQILNRPPENVHILYEPPAGGRIAFGGKWVQY